jgi:hypothetical protein
MLPSIGPVLPIPILSGAMNTYINGRAAARCGDMGAGVWCGGYFPMFEVFLGSSNVWIEMARAGRRLVDITKHCIFSSPRPTDPPLGPMVGSTIMGSSDVSIGGVPMPSLLSLAIARAFKALFRGAGAVFRRLTARSRVDRLIRSGRITIHTPPHAPNFDHMVRQDLYRLARTRSGRALLRDMMRSGKNLDIEFHAPNPPNAYGWSHGHPDSYWNHAANSPGPGANGVVAYDPLQWPNANSARTPSDAVLFHEMNHANNGMNGRLNQQPSTNPGWNSRWQDFEEYNTVNAENGYRYERGVVDPAQRSGYGALP